MVKEKNVKILDKNFNVWDMPMWLWRFDHGTNLITGCCDVWVPVNQLDRVKKFFRNKGIKIEITGYWNNFPL
jgi:hypothetical protein